MTVDVVVGRPRKEGRVRRLRSDARDRAGPLAVLQLPADRGSHVLDLSEWILRKAEGCRVKIEITILRESDQDRAEFEPEFSGL